MWCLLRNQKESKHFISYLTYTIRGISRICKRWHGNNHLSSRDGYTWLLASTPSLPDLCVDCTARASGNFFKVPKAHKNPIPFPLWSESGPLPPPTSLLLPHLLLWLSLCPELGEGSCPLQLSYNELGRGGDVSLSTNRKEGDSYVFCRDSLGCKPIQMGRGRGSAAALLHPL